jgi:hypothetical protein
MWALAFTIFAGLKWLTWWKIRSRISHPAWRSAAYLLAWPGMDARTFLDPREQASPPSFERWLWAFIKTALGGGLLWGLARKFSGEPLVEGWIGIVGAVLLLHFGSFSLIALFWQSMGVRALPIMTNPAGATSLSEFWGKRWNLGFRQLSHDLVFRPLRRPMGIPAATLLVFVLSGLIHDLVISVPAGAGYGLPTSYFLLQGLGVMVERTQHGYQWGLQSGIRGWMFMFLCTCGPIFWLFHPAFIHNVILPLMRAIRAL